MESSIAEFLKRYVASEHAPTVEWLSLFRGQGTLWYAIRGARGREAAAALRLYTIP